MWYQSRRLHDPEGAFIGELTKRAVSPLRPPVTSVYMYQPKDNISLEGTQTKLRKQVPNSSLNNSEHSPIAPNSPTFDINSAV